MAKMEQYIFNVDANTNKAVDKLSEINNLMNQIDKIKTRGADDYFTTNQKDMDKSMRSMSKMSKLYQLAQQDLMELQEQMEAMANTPIPTDAPEEMQKAIRRARAEAEGQSKAAIKQQKALRTEYQRTLQQFQALAQFQQNHSKNFKPVFTSNDLYNLPRGGKTPEEQKDNRQRAKRVVQSMANDKDPVTGRMDDVLAKIQEVNKLERRSESTSRRAAASNYMSHQQKSTFRDDLQKSQNEYKQDRDQNIETITDIGQERTKLHNRVQDIKSNPNATQKELDEKVAIEQTVQSMDEEWHKRMELNRVLERTIKNMENYNESLHGVEVKPERGTFTGMMYERAPAIGLALGAAVGGSLGGMFHQGEGVNKSMRDDVISIGQRTDQEDWRYNVRDEAFSEGMNDKLGFTGHDMLQFQENYLSKSGYEGKEDLRSAAENQAKFSRVSGVDKEGTKQLFNAVYGTGAVNGEQTKDIQDAFIGGIKNSGMEGREKDQISALEGILGSVQQGRTMTNDDVMNVMGLQSVLSGSGNRSLSGAQGGQLLQGMNEGIRSGFNNPMVRLAMGQGTEYQGIEGRFKLRERMDEGINDTRNITDIAKLAQSYMPNSEDGQNEVFASFVQEGLGTDITAEQSEGLMDLYREGALTDENIKGVMEQDKATGEKVGEERYSEYKDSKEGTANQSDAVWEKQVANLNDFGDAIKSVNSKMGDWMSGFYGATVAVVALGAAAAFSALSFGGSAAIRRGMGQTYSSTGARAQRRRNGSGGGGTNGGAGGGLMSRVGGWFGFGGSNRGPNDGPDPNGNGNNRNGRLNGALGKVGGVLGKAAVPLAIAGGVAGYVAAPDDAKGEAAGSAIGGIGGGIAGGMAAGALIGSVVPGIGTAIGGIAGGIAGGIGGSKLGGWIGKQFDGKPEEAAAAAEASGADPSAAAAAAVGAGAATGTSGLATGTGLNGGTGSGAAPFSAAGTGGLAASNMGSIATGTAAVGTLGLASGASAWMNSNPSTASTEEGTPTVNEMNTQVERENTNRKGLAETQRTDNISAERENLTRYETLLDKAQQILNQARSQNGIFGSGTSTDSQSPVDAVLSGNDNTEKVRSFFEQQGFSKESTAGIMGNLMQESGMDPTAVNPESGAFGIGQWLGGRKTNLQNYAKEQGTDVTDLGTQLEFLMQELQGGDSTTKSILDKNGGLTGLKASTDVKASTKLFENAFERSGNDSMEKRYNYAEGYYNSSGTSAQWGDTASKATTASATTNNSKIESTINVVVKGDEKVSDKITDSKDMKTTAARIQQQVYDSLGFYSREMRMT